MSPFTKTPLRILIVSCAITHCITSAMETTSHPTIHAKVSFNPTKLPFYATDDHIKHLNNKGIKTPIQPIIREISTVEVIETDGTTTNWKNNIPRSIKNYEKQLLKQQNPSFGQIDNKTFPPFLPIELSHNCSNGSKISLIIEHFPVQITFASQNNFSAEQSQCILQFFQNPSRASLQSDLKKHVASKVLNKNPIPVILTFIDPITHQLGTIHADRAEYTHGPNGCPDYNTFVRSITTKQIYPQKSVYQYLLTRQINGK